MKTYDLLVDNIGGAHSEPHKDVILLLIDENSLQYGEKIGLGRWPWSRNIYSEILAYINKTDPPKGIFFDIFFVESDLGRGNDTAFSEAIASSGNIFQNVFLDYNSERTQALILPADVHKNFSLRVDAAEKIAFQKNPANEYSIAIPCLRSKVSCETRNEDITAAEPIIKGFSVASFVPDSDGVYRKGRILFSYGPDFFPSLSLAACMAYSGAPGVAMASDNIIRVGKYDIPVDEEGKYLINYYKSSHRIPAYSMSALMASAYYLENGDEDKILIRPEVFRDKIVLIGCSAPGCQDRKTTPIHGAMPGPEIHANIISNILQQNHIHVEPRPVSILFAALIVFLCAGAVLLLNSNVLKISLLAGTVTSYTALHLLLFRYFNYLSPILFILLSGMLSTGISFIYLSMTEGAEKRKYSKILGNLIDPVIVTEALNDLESLKRGGEKNITAFFSDVASFSTISEKLTSVDLAALLNEYLSAMTVILKLHHGTLDKYIGDAIVGIFGAPVEFEDNALWAARAALKMRDKIIVLREEWTNGNKYCAEAQKMDFRIGLNTGRAKVGFMGTENLASYTMMGDNVNLASRLESAAKDYGVTILVSQTTRELIKKEMQLRMLDAIRVMGKNEPVFIYELLGNKENVPEHILKAAKNYEDGFNLYMIREWESAIQKFRESVEIRSAHDKAAEALITRCIMFQNEPPAEDWDGVFTRSSK